MTKTQESRWCSLDTCNTDKSHLKRKKLILLQLGMKEPKVPGGTKANCKKKEVDYLYHFLLSCSQFVYATIAFQKDIQKRKENELGLTHFRIFEMASKLTSVMI